MKSFYDIAVENGYKGTPADFLQTLTDAQNPYPYIQALQNGFYGTLDEYLESLKGDYHHE